MVGHTHKTCIPVKHQRPLGLWCFMVVIVGYRTKTQSPKDTNYVRSWRGGAKREILFQTLTGFRVFKGHVMAFTDVNSQTPFYFY